MYRAPQAEMHDLRPPDLKGMMCPMGSVECHDSENRAMHRITFANFQMGQATGHGIQ